MGDRGEVSWHLPSKMEGKLCLSVAKESPYMYGLINASVWANGSQCANTVVPYQIGST